MREQQSGQWSELGKLSQTNKGTISESLEFTKNSGHIIDKNNESSDRTTDTKVSERMNAAHETYKEQLRKTQMKEIV